MRKIFFLFNMMQLLCAMALPVAVWARTGTDKATNQSGFITGICYTLNEDFVASGFNSNYCYGAMGNDGGVKMRTNRDGNRIVFNVSAPYTVTRFSIEAYSNNTSAIITVTKVEVDGVETAFTGGNFPTKTTAMNSDVSGNLTVSDINATESIAVYFDNSEVVGTNVENIDNKNKQIMAYYELDWLADSTDGNGIILFADPNVRAICVDNWDSSGDGKLSVEEAATVTNLGTVFTDNSKITTFDELQFFTGLTSISEQAFWYCTSSL